MIGGGRRQSIYFRALASLVVMALLSMGTAFCLFYPQELRSVYERVEQRRANALEQTAQAMDKLLDQVYQAALMIEKEDTLRPYALSGGGMALYEASEMVKLFNSMLNDVYMTFYYVQGMEWIVCGSGMVALESFGETVWMLDGMDHQALLDALTPPQSRRLTLYPADTLRQSAQASRIAVLPFSITVASGSRPYGTVLVLLKASDIAEELKRSWEDETLFIADGEQILFSTDDGQTGALEGAALAAAAAGEVVRLEDGRALYMAASDLYGVHYGVLCGPDALYAELQGLRLTALLFLAAACGVALLAALLLSRWNYQPVRQLASSVGVDLRAKGRDSELLQERFHSLISVNAALTEDMRQSRALLEDAIVQRFLASAPGEREAMAERMEKMEPFSRPCACLLALCLPGAEDAPRAGEGAERLFRFRQTALGGYDVLLAVCGADATQEEALRCLGAAAGDGRICHAPLCRQWRELPDLYAQLLQKLHALRQLDGGALVCVDDPRLETAAETSFGAHALDELADSLSACQAEWLRMAVSNLCGCLNDERRSLGERRALTVEALCMLCEALEGQGGLDAKTLEKLNPLARGRVGDAKRMESLLRGAAEAVMAGMPRPDATRQRQLPQDVLLYIDERLLDPDFSIYTTSEAFGLSESAFSHLFKRTFHQTFSTYVNQQKLIRAFELLTDETIPLEEVASRLGYSRASNFGRMFKAEVGMSPGRYRSLYGRGNGADG